MSKSYFSAYRAFWSECMMNLQFIVHNGAKLSMTKIRYKRLVKGKPTDWCEDDWFFASELIQNTNFKVTRDGPQHMMDTITFKDMQGDLIEVELDINELYYLSILIDAAHDAENKAVQKELASYETLEAIKRARFEEQSKLKQD